MSNNLLTEVQRIKEIMGVKSDLSLITEARNPFEEIISSAVNFFKKEIPVGIRTTDPYIPVGLVNVPRSTYNRLTSFLRSGDWDSLSDSEAAYLGQILAQDRNYVDKLYQEEMRKVMNKFNLSETDLIRKMSQELPPNASQADVQNYLANLFRNPNDPSSFKPSNTLSGLVGSKIKNKITDLSRNGKIDEEIASAEAFTKRVGKNMISPVLLAFKQIIGGGFFKSQEKLEKQLDDIFKRIDTKLAEGGGKVSVTKINREVREIFNTIVAMKKSADFGIRSLYDLHITNNPKIPEAVKEELKKEKYVERIMKYANEDLANSTLPVMLQKAQNYVEAIPVLGGLIRGMAKKAIKGEEYKFIDNILAEQLVSAKRLGNIFLWNNPQGLTDVIVNFSRTGKYATLVEKFGYYLAVHNFVIPFIIQTIEGFRENKEIIEVRELIKQILELCGDEVLGLNCPEEDIKELKNYTTNQFWQGFYDKVPLLKPFRDGFEVSDLAGFTYVDEALQFLGEAFNEEVFGDQQTVESILNKTKALREKYKQMLKSKGIDIENIEAYKKAKEVMDRNYDNSPEGFKAYIKDQTGQDTTNLNTTLPNGNQTFWDNEYVWVKEDRLSNKGKWKIKEGQ